MFNNIENPAAFAKKHRIANLNVRDLANDSEEEIWSLPLDELSFVEFEDGEKVLAPNVDIILSWYFWRIAFYYPKVKITKDLLIDGDRFTDDDFRNKLETAILNTRSIVPAKEHVWRIAYKECYNMLYNAVTTKMERFVSGTDATHIQEILDDPDMVEAIKKINYKFSTIQSAYSVTKEVLASDKYPNNPVKESFFNRTVKTDQMLKSFAACGQTTDVDSVQYRRPIIRAYANGLLTINDMIKESRSAAKALLYNKDPVAMAEYFSRKLQLVISVIERLVPGDCGTNLSHEVTLGETDDNILSALEGCYQVLDDGSLRAISAKDKYLLGTTIRFRTALCCLHAEEQGVCETCFGQASYSIPYDTNLGHVCCTANNKELTQNIISTKHLDFIINVFKAILRGSIASWFTTSEKEDDTNLLFYHEARVGMKTGLAFKKDMAPMLSKINYVNNVRAIPDLQDITSLDSVKFYRMDGDSMTDVLNDCDMTMDGVAPSFSYEFLEYIREVGWTDLDDGSYYVNLENWTNTKPMFVYPIRHVNATVFRQRFEHFIRGAISQADETKEGDMVLSSRSESTLNRLTNYKDVDAALIDTFIFVSKKLNRSMISHLAVLLLASRAADPDNHRWQPSNKNNGSFQTHESLIRNRSLGPVVLYERQYLMMEDLKSYTNRVRSPSIMDKMIYIH